MTSRIDEAAFVREHYATEDNLVARKSAYANSEGDDPRELAFTAVAEVSPGRVLEVGGGEGELAERIGWLERDAYGRRRLAEQARAVAVERFALEPRLADYLAVYAR